MLRGNSLAKLDEKGRLVARASSTCMPVPEGQGRE